MSTRLAKGNRVTIRRVQASDLEQIAPYAYTVSIVEPLTGVAALKEGHRKTGLWHTDAGAVSIVENGSARLVGTCQFYRSGPCIHGLELGYIVHAEVDRERGFATEALGLLSQYLFEHRSQYHRQQLVIETWNAASCRVAEKCDFVREGVLRCCGFEPNEPADCFIYSKTRDRGRVGA
jgi:RimJ/RimL family protein N-acetyltransferase